MRLWTAEPEVDAALKKRYKEEKEDAIVERKRSEEGGG